VHSGALNWVSELTKRGLTNPSTLLAPVAAPTSAPAAGPATPATAPAKPKPK
jgi:hypothetical protein